MALKNISPISTAAWQALNQHFEILKDTSMVELFGENPKRAEQFHIRWESFLVDYSKNIFTEQTIKLLLKVAEEAQLPDAIEKYFSGNLINVTENRAVLHTALRTNEQEVYVNGKNIVPEISSARKKIKEFTREILSGQKTGYSKKPFTDVVNIGIGGSGLGPAMVTEALQFYKTHLTSHFISNVDGDHVQEILKKINPETTLFVVVSKTFTTQETLTNAETIRKWFLQTADEKDIPSHFVAISANIQKATDFGIDPQNIFPMWDWVGGRFSLWGAVGLSISLSVGYDNFENLLTGACKMDSHFKNTPFEKNIPIILALLSIWYNNFFGAESEALIPYTQYLQKLIPYLQQSIMESNGKSIDRNGNPVAYQTGTIIWGEPGTNSQHTFFQLIHQGTKLIPADFIGFIKPLHGDQEHHNKLMSNFFAQTEALLKGKSVHEAKKELEEQGISDEKAEILIPFKVFSGNRPTNTLLIDQLTPETLGSLIALYEHKIFVQGVIWNIFSYDQWGVELGKQLANSILDEISTRTIKKHDPSTSLLLDYYNQKSK